MTWYIIKVRERMPGESSRPLPAMKISAESEAEARQMAELFLIDDSLEIVAVTPAGAMNLISPKSAAKIAGVSESLVYSWIRHRLLPHFRFGVNGKGGKILIAVDDLNTFLDSCRVEAGEEDNEDDGPLEFIR